MSLTTTIKASISGEYIRTVAGRPVVDDIPPTQDLLLASGTGNGAADIAFADYRTLASGASENLDLSGSLNDAFGQIVAAGHVKAIEISADAANATNLTVGASGANAFQGPFADVSDGLVVKPGGRLVIADPAGWAVVAGTADLLKVANAAGAAASYHVKIIASSV